MLNVVEQSHAIPTKPVQATSPLLLTLPVSSVAALCHINGAQQVSTTHTNDPSAGSPTETLLRLLLPLSDKVH